MSRMKGSKNETEALVNGQECMVLIDPGSDISNIALGFYESMNPKTEILSMSDFNLNTTGASGYKIPYLGYFEAEWCMPNIEYEPVGIPVLVVPTTGYSGQVPMILVQILLVITGVMFLIILAFLLHGVMYLLHSIYLKLNK